jgi:hypothetical protein
MPPVDAINDGQDTETSNEMLRMGTKVYDFDIRQ